MAQSVESGIRQDKVDIPRFGQEVGITRLARDGVISKSAGEGVRPVATIEQVVAGTAVDCIGPVAAVNGVAGVTAG